MRALYAVSAANQGSGGTAGREGREHIPYLAIVAMPVGGAQELRERKISWISFSTISLAFFAGIAFALGHHAFYSSLAGTAATDARYHLSLGWYVSTQQVNLSIGTAFAFLVKACFGAAVSAAYAQLFWRAMNRTAHAITLGNIDHAFSALYNVKSLFRIWRWWNHPLLFGAAVLTWLMPLASLIPPATLSIENHQIKPQPRELRPVPHVDFASLNFINPLITEGHTFTYDGPSQAVAAVAKVVGSEGQFMPILPPRVNSSWLLHFPGPALECQRVTASHQESIQENIAQAMSLEPANACKYYGFIGWNNGIGWSGSQPCGDDDSLPFVIQNNSSSAKLQPTCFSKAGDSPVVLYMSFIPNLIGSEPSGGQCFASKEKKRLFDGAETIRCDLKNSTYSTSFNYPNGVQQINHTVSPIEESTITGIGSLVFNASSKDSECNKLLDDSSLPAGEQNRSCVPDEPLLRSLSYQGILDAFSYLFIGSIYSSPSTQETGRQSLVAASGIGYSALGHRSELQYLSHRTFNYNAGAKLFDSTFKYANGTEMHDLHRSFVQDSPIPLTQAVEELFQRVVISMMSPSQLQTNEHSPFAPQPVVVSFDAYDNIYIYAASQLWISYSIAAAFTAAAVVVGIIAILGHGGSYSLSFSAVLRATHGAYISADIRPEDTDGRDPLPAYLGQAQVQFNEGRMNQHYYEKTMTAQEDEFELRSSRSSLVEKMYNKELGSVIK